jgi:hypothetical protein
MNFVTTPRGDFMGTREAQITPQTEDRDICLELPQGSYSLGRLRHGEYGDGQIKPRELRRPQRDVTMLRGVRSPAALQAVP